MAFGGVDCVLCGGVGGVAGVWPRWCAALPGLGVEVFVEGGDAGDGFGHEFAVGFAAGHAAVDGG